MPSKSSDAIERELRQFADSYYAGFFIELIAEYVDRLDVLQKENVLLRNQYEFVSTISHQLRTPLNVVRYGLEVISEGLGVTEKELAEGMYEKILNMNAMIANLLYFIEIGGVYAVGRREDFSLSEAAEESMAGLKDKIAAKKISVQFEKTAESDVISGDKKAISRVISFLLDNAVVYNKLYGSVKINIAPADGFIKMTVEDSGIGIPEKEREGIFAKFFRATNASLGKNEGSGISLYLSRMIVDKHQGEIGFESAENRGSVFYITLPLSKP